MGTNEWLEAAEYARDLVTMGAEVALSWRGRISVTEKDDGAGPVTEADRDLDRRLTGALRDRFPADLVLSEEADAPAECADGSRRLWCVDPLDGTREYIEGLPEFAVQVGLLEGGEPVAGAFSLPDLAIVFWGARGAGAFVREGGRDRPVNLRGGTALDDAVLIHSGRFRNGLPGPFGATNLFRETRNAGGAGYKVAQVLLGKADCYVDPRSGMHWWDSAGPAAVFAAAGGWVADANKAPLRYDNSKHEHTTGVLFAPETLRPAIESM
ncbi:MAG: inositol monophosphatase family protein [Planctomycetota bacterium]